MKLHGILAKINSWDLPDLPMPPDSQRCSWGKSGLSLPELQDSKGSSRDRRFLLESILKLPLLLSQCPRLLTRIVKIKKVMWVEVAEVASVP